MEKNQNKLQWPVRTRVITDVTAANWCVLTSRGVRQTRVRAARVQDE